MYSLPVIIHPSDETRKTKHLTSSFLLHHHTNLSHLSRLQPADQTSKRRGGNALPNHLLIYHLTTKQQKSVCSGPLSATTSVPFHSIHRSDTCTVTLDFRDKGCSMHTTSRSTFHQPGPGFGGAYMLPGAPDPGFGGAYMLPGPTGLCWS